MKAAIAPTESEVDALYRATTNPTLIVVPPLRFLCMDGQGDPNTSPAYEAAIQALYSVAYTLKFTIKKAGGPTFKVSPLEGLWWADDPAAFANGEKSAWNWTMMIRVPDVVTDELFEECRETVATKKSMPAARELRLSTFEEGTAAQILHVGPYASEGPTILRLHDFIRALGFTFDDSRYQHHEIYLGDPRRTAPERLRTIIRQPYADPHSANPQ